MSIAAFERYKKLAAYGDAIGREGMSALVAKAVADWQREGCGPKSAMILAGRLKAITQMATRDDYWKEQVDKGFIAEYRAINTENTK